ncbi:hypothetical protein [Halopelagius longus]|uniref:Uncharacterized protein n=1 Tax=Halopelagius longus TaxID=1236180 RepID=A0A1H1EFB2_9EURY|nr:hypothetical protein [Halopelagius longus]RDI71733.1 hypothetical protein DWB78_08340 [Halopelagius longus]SDQ87417.1 hypothetical protein SAMN05216278_2880 [Halopelagius longus]
MTVLDRGTALAVAAGLFLTAMGALAIVDPKIQGARDVNVIDSEEVGSGEKFGSRLGGVVLAAMGLFVLFLVVYIKLGYGF